MMGKRPQVRWQKSQNTRKFQNRQQSWWHLALYILYAATLSMLHLFAVSRMAEDRFGPLLNAGSFGSLWGAVLAIPVSLVWNEVLYNLGKTRMRLVGNLVILLAFLLGIWYYYRDQISELIRGFYGLGQRYLDAWNSYFITSLRIDQALQGNMAEEQLAWGMLLTVSMIFLQIFSASLRKRSVLLVLPAVVLAAEMTVGLTPEWTGMSWMFIAGMLGVYLDGHRRFQAVPALVLAGLLILLLPISVAVLEKPASRVSLVHDRLQAFQHQIEQGIMEYGWQALLMIRRDGRLDNQKPEYTHREMLTVTVSELPTDNLYLRGYYGAEYLNGSWDTGEKDFDRACRRYGIGDGEAAQLLAEFCSLTQASAFVPRVQYEMEYTGEHGSLAYLPYGADLKTAQDHCKVVGDYLVEKAWSLNSLAFEGYAPGSLVLNDMRDWNQDEQSFYSWYNDYVAEHYLAVSGDLPELTRTVNSLMQSDVCQTAQQGLENGDVAGRNLARLLLGNQVAQELQHLARYNIDPGSLPKGVDPVEYFLGENRQGYCMHFATAGALILRQMGVPARFVSGYVVTPDQFRKTSSGYRVSVKDDASHAWVEIWLEQVGWVPVEMTPGFGETGTVLTAQGQQVMTPPSEEQEDKEQTDSGDMDSQKTEAAPLPTAKPQDRPQEDGREPEEPGMTGPGILAVGLGSSGAAGGSDMPEGWGFAGEGGWAIFGQNGSLQVSHVVLVLAGILAAAGLVWLIVFWLLRRRTVWWEKVRTDIESGSARSAVKVINRKMYKRLRRKRAGFLTLGSDQEYLAALQQQYFGITQKDWENYLEVVRKAVYSQEEISPEQARSCYVLLRRTQIKEGRSPHNSHKKRQSVTE